VQPLVKWIESTGQWSPLLMVALFLAAALLTIWRLESISAGGLEGTVIGTLVTPYITGLGNLIFAYVIARQKDGSATDVLTNCLVNNVTNMTLVLGIPAVIWRLNLNPAAVKKSKGKKPAKAAKPTSTNEVNRLSLLLTLTAVLFFTGATWALGADGSIGLHDGMVLVGLFLFWQCFHVFEVLKTNARHNRGFSWMLPIDLALLALGAWATYVSTKWLVDWVSAIHTGFISQNHLGLLSGWLDVLPNAILALYYGFTKRPEVVYTSQVGDNHICIPLCIGVFALFKTIAVPAFFQPGIFILVGATLVHFLFIAVLGRLPRFAGFLLILAYGYFLWAGFLK
jgi:cation:H+ antiporter